MNLAADKDRSVKLIGSIRDSVSLLQELATESLETFQQDRHKQSSAKYNLIAAIEAAIDLASHIIAKNKLRAPNDYGDTFAVLAEAGVYDQNFSSELHAMARFRNRLVHLYWDIDIEQLYGIIQTRLGDFEKYIEEINRHILWR
jgi:uncharacterized protein YutE (UPF0331/DUF86 family)